MKILLFYEPSLTTLSIKVIQLLYATLYDHLYQWVGLPLSGYSVEIKTVVPESILHAYSGAPTIPGYQHIDHLMNFIVLSDHEFEEALGSPIDWGTPRVFGSVCSHQLSDERVDRFSHLLLRKLNGWVPDIVVTFPVFSYYLKNIFPNSLILNQENAIFSRPPFMRTLFYDPCGFGGLNFLNQFSDAIINAPITPNQNDQLQRLKERIVQFIDLHNPLRERIKSERARFEFCVLLPAAECTYIHNEYEFKSDMHMLDHVMKQIPPHIGVFLTVHDGDVVLTRPVIEYFQSKYPNLLFISPIAKHVYAYSHSLYFFNDVDAIINPISGTGILSLFWDKKIISIANRYNSWFEDTQGLDGLENVLRQPIVNKNNRLHWYLTHYAVFENDFLKPGWLAQYFQSKYDRYQAKGINADYFEPLQDIDTVSQYIISSLDHYGLTSARKKEKNWWQKIMGNLPTKSIG